MSAGKQIWSKGLSNRLLVPVPICTLRRRHRYCGNSELEISIQRLNDVVFEEDGEPVKLIQAKRHILKKGNLKRREHSPLETLGIGAERGQGGGGAISTRSF